MREATVSLCFRVSKSHIAGLGAIHSVRGMSVPVVKSQV